jgi:hypothetical protein
MGGKRKKGEANSRWKSLLPPEKALPAGTDGAMDVLMLAGSELTAAERAIAEEVSKLALAKVDPHAKVGRVIYSLGEVSELDAKLQELTASTMGLDGIQGSQNLKYSKSETDPGVFVAKPIRAGAPCPTHQDYNPASYRADSKAMSFTMLLQATTKSDGATYYFPGSRAVQKRERAPKAPKARGRPPKSASSKDVLHDDGFVAAQNLDRDLEKRFGRVVLAGDRLSIFRTESANWHGAYHNRGGTLRCILIWTYSTHNLAGAFQVVIH